MDNSNNTQVNVHIGANGSYKSVLSGAISDFKNFWKTASGGNDAEGASRAFEDLANKLGATDSKARLVGGVLAGTVAAGVVAIGVESVKSAIGFQTLTTMLVTGAGESQSNLAMVQQGILSISDATGTSATSLAQGMYMIESAGYHGAAGLNVLKASAEGAAADGASLTTMSDALTTVLTDYHEPASQAAQVTDQMVAAVSAGKMHMEDFASSLSTVLPIAKQVGLSFAQVAGAESTLTAQGVSANQATLDLHAVISTLQAPTSQQTKLMQQLGLNSVTLAQNMGKEGLTGTLSTLTDAITKNMGPAGLVIQKTMQNATNATADFKTMVSSAPAQLKTLGDQLQDGTISFTSFKQQVQALPEGMTNLGKQMETTYNKTKSFNSLLTSGSPQAQTYAQTLKTLTGQSNSMSAVMMLTGANAGTFADNVKKVGDAAKSTGSNISDWKTIQGEEKTQMDEAKASITNAMTALGMGLLPAVISITKAISDVLKPIAEWIAGHEKLSAIILMVIGVFATLVAAILLINKTFMAAKTAMTLLSDSFLGTAAKAVWSATTTSVAWIASAVATAAAWVAANAVMLLGIGLIIAIVVGAVYEIIKHWSDVKQWFMDFVHDVGGFFTSLGHVIDDVWQAAVKITEKFIEDIKKIFKAMEPALKDIMIVLLAILLLPLVPTALAWREWHTEIIQGFKDAVNAIEAVWQALVNFFKTIINGMKAAFNAVIGFIVGIFQREWNGLVNIWNALVGFFKPIIAGVLQVFSSIKGFIVNLFKQEYNGVVNAFTPIVDFMKRIIGEVVNAIKSGVSSFGTMLYDSGKDLINGLIKGVEDAAKGAADAVKNVASDMVKAAKSELKIFSPSRVFAEIGGNVGAGLVQGVQGSTAAVQQATTQLGTAAIVGGQAALGNTTSNTTNNTSNNNSSSSQNVSIGQISLGSSDAVQAFFKSLNQDSLNVSKGLSVVQGAY
jgi:TP901 family phage tail tape measure protein